jgi:hypothetical protein
VLSSAGIAVRVTVVLEAGWEATLFTTVGAPQTMSSTTGMRGDKVGVPNLAL